MEASEFLTGLGYLYQGAWLGTHPLALKKITIRLTDIAATEEDDFNGRSFMRVITKAGATFIVFQVNDPRPEPTAKVIDATIARPMLTGSQESAAKPRRIIYLPASTTPEKKGK